MAKLHYITKEEQQALWAEDNQVEGTEEMQRLVAARMQNFWKTYDFTATPSRYAKQIAGYSKNDILLDIWSQYIAQEEAMGEIVFGLPVGETLGKMTRFEIVKHFSAYLASFLEEVEPHIGASEEMLNNNE